MTSPNHDSRQIENAKQLTRPSVDLAGLLLGGPKLSDTAAEALAEVEAERRVGFGHPASLEAGW
jgi:hypothetical protein